MNKIVCINIDDIDNAWHSVPVNLTLWGIYDVIKDESMTTERYYIKDDKGDLRHYYSRRFISIKEYRKKKLKKIIK